MLGRLYAFLFIVTIALLLWYQKRYLDESSEIFQAQLNSENLILPTSSVNKFQTRSYENGYLKYSFSGDKIIYFTDNHFEAIGNLVYKTFDNQQKESSVIKTTRATGQMELIDEKEGQTALSVGANSRIKYAILPDEVSFNFNENIGKTKNIYIDMINQNIQSDSKIESNGPQGKLKGKGFSYSIKDEEFKIKSDVDGKISLPEDNKNKLK
ncbi:LPS export ABC transporter periplasmic protein LptC [Fluviispira multicolorata]|uniref:LPS export ABC transporter periplasmic protein LptC n=1 Tax=Fluviispira multicolorata TaxID=2654512 RepID=A0A833N351_9BACT|nr:LPS export ABC transporter periplasmic protein LptC [Fluviispira multicolorata]KAB8027764.1 hypothetical protein GCL57_14250 [Fluviispira multicolorata]